MKADVKLEIDEQGLAARVTLTPSAQGRELTAEAIVALLKEKGVKEGIVTELVEKAVRAFQRKPGEPLAFTAAQGLPPRPTEPEKFVFAPLAIPPRLATLSKQALARAKAPEAFRLSERKVQKKKKVLKKASLPFLPPKEVIETVVVKETVREKVDIDPAVREAGYVLRDGVVAHIAPGKQGKEGRSIYGRLVPAPRVTPEELHLGDGLARSGAEIKAVATGFLRRGDTWCDLVPFKDHEAVVTVSADKQACFLAFTPGDRALPMPTAAELAAQAVAAGLPRERLLPEKDIQRLLEEALASGKPLAKAPLTPSADAAVAIQVSPDKLKATLTIRKGKGAGKRLTLPEISNAIRASGVRGYNPEVVKKDLTEFYSGPREELAGYLLAEGKAPEKGEDGRLEWVVRFAKAEETGRIKEQSLAAKARLSGLKSLSDFPLTEVKSVTWVQAGEEVLRVFPATAGEPGVDVYKALVPGIKGAEPEVRLFEGLKKQKDSVTAAIKGLLEKGGQGGTVLLRVRPHRDAELLVTVSEDRMQGKVAFFPAEGTGKSFTLEELKTKLALGGVSKGIEPARFTELAKAVQAGQPLKDLPIAMGRPPKPAPAPQIAWSVHLASGASVTITESGRADFRHQDKLTSVKKDELIAILSPPGMGAEDGWDVSGKPIRAPTEREASLTAGKGVRSLPLADGRVQFLAQQDGELFLDRNLLEVKEVHAIAGDVGLATGNVKFAGVVQIRGSVQSGFVVEAGDDVLVEQAVQAATVRSGGNLSITQGVKGEGKAVLAAAKSVVALFVEQAEIRAGEDVRINNACVRSLIRSNGRLTLVSDKGNLVGGRVQARRGLSVQNLGSPSGTRTEVSFGQDYLLLDKIEQEQAEGALLAARVSELKQRVHQLERPGSDRKALELTVAERREAQDLAEKSAQKLAALQEQFKKNFPAVVEVRGVLYPGVILESHGRTYAPTAEKHLISLTYDEKERAIKEKI